MSSWNTAWPQSTCESWGLMFRAEASGNVNRSVSLQADALQTGRDTLCSFPATSASAAANSGASRSLGFCEEAGAEPRLSQAAE